jgi:hypothetical protein
MPRYGMEVNPPKEVQIWVALLWRGFLLPRRIVSAPVIRALSHTPPAAYPATTSLK